MVGPVNVVEYNSLTEEERAKLIHEFEEDKATKVKGLHQSSKARVSDVTYTVQAIENEVSDRFVLQDSH